MKELSIEQKAKCYDEAIERAKKWYNAPNVDKIPTFGNRVIEEIFPELKESEDERIREAIICGMYALKDQHKTRFASIPIDNVIAWLEKQGEQKIAWSEEYERIYRGLHNLIYSTPYCDSRKELSDFLDSLKNRVQSNLQQEWSEEDEKCVRLSTDIIDSALRAGFCVQLDRDRCVDWLKSLRPQNRWKPSDEQMSVLKEQCVCKKSTVAGVVLCELFHDLKKLTEE